MSAADLRRSLGQRPGWQEQAACHGKDPELFFPGAGDNRRVKAAKAICATCPVSAQCLEYAQLIKERRGIWGGLTDRERLALRSPHRIGKTATHGLSTTYSAGCNCDECRATWAANQRELAVERKKKATAAGRYRLSGERCRVCNERLSVRNTAGVCRGVCYDLDRRAPEPPSQEQILMTFREEQRARRRANQKAYRDRNLEKVREREQEYKRRQRQAAKGCVGL